MWLGLNLERPYASFYPPDPPQFNTSSFLYISLSPPACTEPRQRSPSKKFSPLSHVFFTSFSASSYIFFPFSGDIVQSVIVSSSFCRALIGACNPMLVRRHQAYQGQTIFPEIISEMYGNFDTILKYYFGTILTFYLALPFNKHTPCARRVT